MSQTAKKVSDMTRSGHLNTLDVFKCSPNAKYDINFERPSFDRFYLCSCMWAQYHSFIHGKQLFWALSCIPFPCARFLPAQCYKWVIFVRSENVNERNRTLLTIFFRWVDYIWNNRTRGIACMCLHILMQIETRWNITRKNRIFLLYYRLKWPIPLGELGWRFAMNQEHMNKITFPLRPSCIGDVSERVSYVFTTLVSYTLEYSSCSMVFDSPFTKTQ